MAQQARSLCAITAFPFAAAGPQPHQSLLAPAVQIPESAAAEPAVCCSSVKTKWGNTSIIRKKNLITANVGLY